MAQLKSFTLAAATSLLLFGACHSNNGGSGNNTSDDNAADTTSSTRKVSVVISSIPFPSSTLDTLYKLDIKYHNDLLNPIANISLYSKSNAQAANLGVFGADLAYVISFEQFQAVGDYMKATKYLADNIGVPLAFTAQVVERCRENQNNKDSLTRIMLQSYNIIDRTLTQGSRDASEVLVITGGWVEGIYLTTQSLDSVPQGTRRMRLYRMVMEQKEYTGKLLKLLNDVGASSLYCKNLIAPMQEIKSAFDVITTENTFNNNTLQSLAGKVKSMRSQLVKGGL